MQKKTAIGILRNITMARDLLVAPLKMPCPGTLLRNPDFDIGKKVIKIKNKTVFLLIASTFYESNLQ